MSQIIKGTHEVFRTGAATIAPQLLARPEHRRFGRKAGWIVTSGREGASSQEQSPTPDFRKTHAPGIAGLAAGTTFDDRSLVPWERSIAGILCQCQPQIALDPGRR